MKIINILFISLLCLFLSEQQLTAQVAKTATKTATRYGVKSSRKAVAKSFAMVAREKAMKSVSQSTTRLAKAEIKNYSLHAARLKSFDVFEKAIGRVVQDKGSHWAAYSTQHNTLGLLKKDVFKTQKKNFAPTKSLTVNTEINGLKRRTSSFVAKEAITYTAKIEGKQAKDYLMKHHPHMEDVLRKMKDFEDKLIVETSNNGYTRVSYKHGFHPNDVMEIKGNKVWCSSGSIKNPSSSSPYGDGLNVFLNNPMPNMTYIVDGGATYYIDELGRTKGVKADVLQVFRLHGHDRGRRPNFKEVVNAKDGVHGKGMDEGGHLVGYQLGGCHESVNILPQHTYLNHSNEWRQMEDAMAEAVKMGKQVNYEIEAIYKGTSKRPTVFNAKVIIDGKKTNYTFENPPV